MSVKQPAFIYATYPSGTTVTATSGSAPSALLIADESSSFSFDNLADGQSLTISLSSPMKFDCFALVGSNLAGVTYFVFGSYDGVSFPYLCDGSSDPFTSDVKWNRWNYNPPGNGYFSHYRFAFYNLNSSHKIKHIALSPLALLPFMADGYCAKPVQADGEHLISHAGLFLGSVTYKVTRPFSLAWDQIDPTEEALFSGMVDQCVKKAQGLFFVPDTDQPDVHFGWIDKKYKYEPKMKIGLYQIPSIPFTSRAL